MLSKGKVKRRTAEETRRFDRLNKLRSRADSFLSVNREVMEKWEDMAADSEDEDLAIAILECIQSLRATIMERDAVRSMQRRLNDQKYNDRLSHF